MSATPIAGNIHVELVYALPDQQPLMRVQLAEGASVEDAIRVSGILEAFPEIDLSLNKVGIFSKLVKLDEKVRDKDRVEIYRPLIADPKEVRRKRAEEGKVTKKGGGDAPTENTTEADKTGAASNAAG
jgi:putative ubiquitin-RnfH superfamily antitoxin RatB of RatAB toxin-antitoxin module